MISLELCCLVTALPQIPDVSEVAANDTGIPEEPPSLDELPPEEPQLPEPEQQAEQEEEQVEETPRSVYRICSNNEIIIILYTLYNYTIHLFHRPTLQTNYMYIEIVSLQQ